MAITPKFNYVPLSRETIGGSRKYATPDGLALPSVTTILEATKAEESKQALAEWRKNVGHVRATEITKEASGRGNRMHSWLEKYVTNDLIEDPGSNPYSKQSHQMAKVIIDQGLVNCTEYWGTEIGLYVPQLYAGTTDLVGLHSNAEAAMDFKQTNKPKRIEWIQDYFCQLVAYGEAHNELHGTEIRKGVIFMCSAAFEYQEFIIEGNEYDRFKDIWWKRVEQYYLSH